MDEREFDPAVWRRKLEELAANPDPHQEERTLDKIKARIEGQPYSWDAALADLCWLVAQVERSLNERREALLMARSLCDDPFPDDLHLADIMEKYVFRAGMDEGHP